ncbi:MAG: hypothetical protein CM15mV110_050 [Caudoviricetes sp.]|nr:MAG: hypothetical protein CM15mV110_050 [Caudoviricetes sp.]
MQSFNGGSSLIRHSNKTDGTGTFANSVDLVKLLLVIQQEEWPALEGNNFKI